MQSAALSLVRDSANFLVSQVRARLAPVLRERAASETPGHDFSWLQTYEKPLIALQSLMFWENASHTILFLFSFHCSYWYAVLSDNKSGH